MFHSWNIHSWVFPVIVVHCYVADSGSSPLCEENEFYDKVFEACSQCSDVCLPIETDLCRLKCSRFNKILSSSLQSASSSSATTAAHDDHLTTIAIAVVCVVVMLVTVVIGVAICILRNRKQMSRDRRRTNVNTNLEMTSRSLMTSSDQSTSQRTETLHDYTQLTTPSQNGSGLPRHDLSAVHVEDIKSSLCSADTV